MSAIRQAIIALLLLFYFFLIYLMFNPDVSPAYRAYYITHESPVWQKTS
jgi:hypothetical protein